jgi:hypothetical protein
MSYIHSSIFKTLSEYFKACYPAGFRRAHWTSFAWRQKLLSNKTAYAIISVCFALCTGLVRGQSPDVKSATTTIKKADPKFWTFLIAYEDPKKQDKNPLKDICLRVHQNY